MAGKYQPNRDKISLFCHNKVQKPYLTRYSVNKFYKVRKKESKVKICDYKCNNYLKTFIA